MGLLRGLFLLAATGGVFSIMHATPSTAQKLGFALLLVQSDISEQLQQDCEENQAG